MHKVSVGRIPCMPVMISFCSRGDHRPACRLVVGRNCNLGLPQGLGSGLSSAHTPGLLAEAAACRTAPCPMLCGPIQAAPNPLVLLIIQNHSQLPDYGFRPLLWDSAVSPV